jgi:hypothetical protein
MIINNALIVDFIITVSNCLPSSLESNIGALGDLNQAYVCTQKFD